MSDINVIVSNFPIQVDVTPTPINVGVAIPGVAGPPGPQGGNGGGGGSTNIVGLISTGDADLRYYSSLNPSGYITGFNSGLYYLVSNPNNFARSGDLANTGTALQNQINNIINGTGDFYLKSNPNNFISTGAADLRYLVSGASGNFYLVSNPNNYIKSGEVVGIYYPITNPAQYIKSGEVVNIYVLKTDTGNFINSSNLVGLISTGSADSRYLASGASGQFYLKSNPNNFSSSGNVEASGTNLQNQIFTERNKNTVTGFQVTGSVGITGYFNIVGIYGTNVILSGSNIIGISGGGGGGSSQPTNIVGLISTGDADLRYLASGASGQFYRVTNPNNFISSGNVDTKLIGLITTGQGDLRYLLSGASGNFYLTSNPNQFIKSGDVLIISGSLQQNLERSGNYLFGLISASSAGVSSINSASGVITINGAGNVSIITAGQTITVSGNTGEYINFYKTNNPNQFIKSGDVNNLLVNVVYKTGEQFITGYKNFEDKFSQGINNLSSGEHGFSQGDSTLALGYASHSEGYVTIASGDYSHAEGYNNIAGGLASHVAGLENIALGDYQVVFGQYNATDTGAMFVIGGGNSINNRRNILLVNTGGLVIDGTGNILELYQNGVRVATLNGLNGLISTGSADLRYLASGASGQFYLRTNPNNFATSGNLESTGTSLQNQINTERNKNTVTGVSISGGLGLTGAFNINAGSNISLIRQGLNTLQVNATIPPGFPTSGQLSNTGTSLLNTISLYVDRFSNQTITGDKTFVNTIVTNYLLGIGSSSTIDLSVGGLVTNDAVYSIDWNSFLLTNAGELVTLDWNSRGLSGNWTKDGNYILTSLDSGNLINYINSRKTITGVSITGGLGITGEFNISAGSNITLTQLGNNTLSISSAGGGSSISNAITGLGTNNYIPKFTDNSGLINSNVYQSGNLVGINTTNMTADLDLRGNILISGGSYYLRSTNPNSLASISVNGVGDLLLNAQSNGGNIAYVYLYPAANNMALGNPVGNKWAGYFNDIRSTGNIYVSGQIYKEGNPYLTGVLAGTNVTVENNNNGTFTINSTAGGTNNYYINSGSGIFIYRSGIQSGVETAFINFPTILDARPIVIATLHNDNFNDLISVQISGANPTGFHALFSEFLPRTGYYLDIQACSSNPSGMTPTVIVNNVVGSSSTTSYINFQVQSVKLPTSSSAAAARIDAGNINWEVLFAPTGTLPQSGIWQFTCPADYSNSVTPKLYLNLSMKDRQTGICTLSMRASVYSVPPFGQSNVNNAMFDTANTGNLTLSNNLSGNYPLQMIIPLTNNSGMNTGSTVLIRLDRNITTFGAGVTGASGDCALLGMMMEYTKV